jgi:hypothetical protein
MHGTWSVRDNHGHDVLDTHGQDLFYLSGAFRRLTSGAPRGHALRRSAREVSVIAPYSTFSHTSTRPSRVAVSVFPSKTNDGGSNGALNWMRLPSIVTGALRVCPERS